VRADAAQFGLVNFALTQASASLRLGGQKAGVSQGQFSKSAQDRFDS